MAAAYAYADNPDDNQPPDEVLLLRYIDRFGYQAVCGDKPIEHRLAKRMIIAENVTNAYHARDGYRDSEGQANWAEWAQKNKGANKLLSMAEKAAMDGE